MKLRIKSNSLRLRLERPEVAQLCQQGNVFSVCHFGDHHLTYGVRKSNGEDMKAVFVGNRILVDLPQDWLATWESDDRVGFETTDEEGLFVLVEKDF